MSTQLSEAQAYLTQVANHADPAIRASYNMIPDVFIQQIFGNAEGKCFVSNFLDASLVSDTNYNNMSVKNTDYFRVELIDGNVTAAGDPSFKLRITGKMGNDYQMVPMVKGALPDGNSKWLQNFRSDVYQITQQDVAAGKVTEADYQTILEYCKVWKEVGNNAMYTPQHKGNRLSFIARNSAFLLTFQIQVRPNTNPNRKPSDPLWTPGITQCSWNNVFLLHRQGGQTANAITIASSVSEVGPAPVVDRSFTPTTPVASAAPGRNPFVNA